MNASVQAYASTARDQQRDQLVLEHLEFVSRVFGKLAARLPTGTDKENLEAAGVLGLVEAARGYDEKHGIPFQTYAYPRIRGAMLDELRRNCPLPQTMMQKISRVQRAYEQLSPPVSPEKLAKIAKMSIEEVDECLQAVRLTQPRPWNDLLSTVHDCWKADISDPQHSLELKEAKEILADGIEQLPEKERVVLTMYYHENLRQREIAEVIRRSESQVSKLLSRAEFRLKEYVRARESRKPTESVPKQG